MIPPISPIDAEGEWWRRRRTAWLRLGFEEHTGREHMPEQSALRSGRALLDGSGARTGLVSSASTFDPVLAEVALSWYSVPGDTCVDPFAGGPTRGAVAALLGLTYRGFDIRGEQVDANRRWAEARRDQLAATWVTGDARALSRLAPPADIILTCPPYFDLEVYSDDPRDLSASSDYAAFSDALREIAGEEIETLRDDRFCIWIVGDVRDNRGCLRGIVGDTIRAHLEAGFRLANDVVYLARFGTIPVTAARPFSLTRSIARRQQHMLVFAKGDARAAGRRVAGQSPRLASIPDDEQLNLLADSAA